MDDGIGLLCQCRVEVLVVVLIWLSKQLLIGQAFLKHQVKRHVVTRLDLVSQIYREFYAMATGPQQFCNAPPILTG